MRKHKRRQIKKIHTKFTSTQMSQLNIWPTFQPELGDSNSKLRNDETQTEEKTINIHAYFTQVAVSSWTSLHSYNQTSEMEGSKLRDWNTRLNKLKYLSYEDNSNEKNKWKVKRWEVLKNARWHLYGLSMWEKRQMEAIEWVCSLWTRRDEDKDRYIREHKLIQDRNLRLLRK